jgi:DNA-binding Lrp family transcriptional regulator
MTDAWMTYRELADALGISVPAAQARARRNVRLGRWRHRTDNDAMKTARVLVAADDLAAMRQEANRATKSPTSPATSGDTTPL